MANSKPDSHEITIAAIEQGRLVEDETLDFKRQLNLDDSTGRERLIDDVVAFLNRGPASIIVGVEEAAGAFTAFRPMQGNQDAYGQKLLSIIQNGIDPVPLDVRVQCHLVQDGFIAEVVIPRHHRGPYQNVHTGAYRIRTGAQNRPISGQALRGYFVDEKAWLDAAVNLTREEDERLLRSQRMTDRGPTMHFGIVPRAHFEPLRSHFRQGDHWRVQAPGWDGARALFEGCDGGNEAFVIGGDGKGASRLLVRDDWFLHGWVAWPFWSRPGEGTVTLYEFKKELLPRYLEEIDAFLAEQQVEGPFAMLMEVRNLQRDDKVGFYFRQNEKVSMRRPHFLDRVSAMVDVFVPLVMRSSVF